MLLVKTKIGPSTIAGTGLFANQFISKGTAVWKFQKDFDLELSKVQFESLSEAARGQVLNYCYFSPKTEHYIVCSDDARFLNHSDNPNIDSGPDDDHIDVALCDIKPGEELTQNYKVFDGDWYKKLGTGNL
jgi:SET domain-containing protein